MRRHGIQKIVDLTHMIDEGSARNRVGKKGIWEGKPQTGKGFWRVATEDRNLDLSSQLR